MIHPVHFICNTELSPTLSSYSLADIQSAQPINLGDESRDVR